MGGKGGQGKAVSGGDCAKVPPAFHLEKSVPCFVARGGEGVVPIPRRESAAPQCSFGIALWHRAMPVRGLCFPAPTAGVHCHRERFLKCNSAEVSMGDADQKGSSSLSKKTICGPNTSMESVSGAFRVASKGSHQSC